MKLGFCYIAERSEAVPSLRRIIRTLRLTGARLSNPSDGRITHLVGDGDAVDVTEAGLIEALTLRDNLTPQFWVGPSTYFACSLRRLGGSLVRHFYSLDGLDDAERQKLITWAIDYFRDAVDRRTALLLVVDFPGRTAEVDWDAVVVENAGLPSLLPDVLALPASWAAHVNVPPECSRERLHDFEILTLRPGGG